LIYSFFDDDELLRISNKVREKEKNTAGEICVSIKEKTSWNEKKKTLKHLAETEFFRLGVDNTRDKTGILIFVFLEKRGFYILADKGINEKVSTDTWNNITDEMQQMFVKGNFCGGIISAVEKVGDILTTHFPIKPDDKNELPNRVSIN
ncbi:MAG: TPM domain-containing protein, partial [Ignavibacteriaceae bacterium]|nr:TPM domain-containing protein [Ignavibacteriaceae bacterium]